MTTLRSSAFMAATGVLLTACAAASLGARSLTPTARPRNTASPTHTSRASPPPSPPAREKVTATPTSAFPLPLPKDPPVTSWRGIRIMPDAISGEEVGSGGYAFTTLASKESIEQFYIREMKSQGWAHVATGTTATGGWLIVFSGSASVSVLPVGDEYGTNFVMIVTP